MSFLDCFKSESTLDREFRQKNEEADHYFRNEIRNILSGPNDFIVDKLKDLYQEALDNRFISGNITFEIHELIYKYEHNCA